MENRNEIIFFMIKYSKEFKKVEILTIKSGNELERQDIKKNSFV